MIEDKILKNAVVGTGIGAISGGGIGAAIANLMGRNPWLGALIGAIPGAATGAYVDYNRGEGRSRENIAPKLTAGGRDFSQRVALQSLVNPNEEGGLTLGDIWGEPKSYPNSKKRYSSFQPSSGFVTPLDTTERDRRQAEIDRRVSQSPEERLEELVPSTRGSLANVVDSFSDEEMQALSDAGIDPREYIDAFVNQRIGLGQRGRHADLDQVGNAFRRLMEEKASEGSSLPPLDVTSPEDMRREFHTMATRLPGGHEQLRQIAKELEERGAFFDQFIHDYYGRELERSIESGDEEKAELLRSLIEKGEYWKEQRAKHQN